MWILSRDNVVIKPRQQIQSKKFIFTIIWNRSGFYVMKRLLNDTKMNSAYFVTNVLISLEEAIFPQGRVPRERWFVIHLDNYSIQKSRVSTDWLEEYDIVCRPQPIYSPDLALVTSTCFLQSKKNSSIFNWLTRTSFWVSASDFELSQSRRIECHISGLSAASSRSEWR
jgi:hypothetical protein